MVWIDWFTEAGAAVYDGGSPVTGEHSTIDGYSVLPADSRATLDDILQDHPDAKPGTIEVLKFVPAPDPRST